MVRDALQSSVTALGGKSRIYDKEQPTLTLPLTHSFPDLRAGTPSHLALTSHRGEKLRTDREGKGRPCWSRRCQELGEEGIIERVFQAPVHSPPG